MRDVEEVILTRDVPAALVPWGTTVTLKAGDPVQITQQLGGSFTVVCEGSMYRIEGKDADALGKEVSTREENAGEVDTTLEEIEAAAWAQMASCYDPEIPIDIVELGLVYECMVTPLEEGKRYRVDVKMTLTAPGCGMGAFLTQEVRDKLLSIPGVAEANVELVWEPPWNRDMMSEAAKLEAGML
ncbi:MAG: putative Fe-S cluster assembly protein SufT [Pseudomonadota bacterium]|jgi:probable FeS assembly SUF system protein SufT